MNRRIIDMHGHLFPDESAVPGLEKAAESLGIEKIVLHGLEWPGSPMSRNAAVREAMKRRPGLFVGFGGIDMWESVDHDRVDRLRDEGFTGLKFIVPPEPYHSETFFPYYERAERLGMPVLFHLGIVAADATKNVRVDNNYMRPIYLDTIARSFRDLTVIGAHLGNPWFEEATMSARWNPNLFFDITGSTLKKKKPRFIGELLWWDETTEYGSSVWSSAWQQILFGTDVVPEKMHDVLGDYERLLEALGVADEYREAVLHGTGARILGKAGVAV